MCPVKPGARHLYADVDGGEDGSSVGLALSDIQEIIRQELSRLWSEADLKLIQGQGILEAISSVFGEQASMFIYDAKQLLDKNKDPLKDPLGWLLDQAGNIIGGVGEAVLSPLTGLMGMLESLLDPSPAKIAEAMEKQKKGAETYKTTYMK
jgi:hypothetical protein